MTDLPGSSINSIDNAASFQPFTGDPVQSNRLKAFCQVVMAGTDVTNKLDPHLISVHIIDSGMSECNLEIDDRDASMPIPPLGSPVSVLLGWQTENSYEVFNGTTQDFEHGFGRKQGGRRMWVRATGANMLSKIKNPITTAIGLGDPPGTAPGQGPQVTLQQFMSQSAQFAGANIQVLGSLAGVTRSHWAQTGESFMQLGNRLASEFGAVFRVTNGNQAILVRLNELNLGTINAQWGVNLIGWRVRPMAARPSWQGGSQTFYDIFAGQYKTNNLGFGLNNPWSESSGVFRLPTPAGHAQMAGQQNTGQEAAASLVAGDGRICINGEPKANWGVLVNVIGARPGVDGIYLIHKAEHIWSRQGYITWLDVYPNTVASTNNINSSGWSASATGTYPPSTPPVIPIAASATPSIVTNPDGSTTTTVPNPDGSYTTIVTDSQGAVVSTSSSLVLSAQASTAPPTTPL